MKKLFLLCPALMCFYFKGEAQTLKTSASSPILVVDTLHYYFNKFYFKTGVTDLVNFPYYKAPCSTATDVTYCGSRFDVPAGETVTVTGLEAYVQFNTWYTNSNIAVGLYLYELDANGFPRPNAVDGVTTSISSTSAAKPIVVGGAFTHSNVLTPHTMTAGFAVLVKILSTFFGDTVRILRTNGATYANLSANPDQRYADEENNMTYAFVNYAGNFYGTKDFSAPGFGAGTQYEFLVAPHVTYTMQASHLMPPNVAALTDTITPTDTMCTRIPLTFTNTSSAFWEHRMYNLNQFYRKWNLYSEFKINSFSQDSCITWKFEFMEGLASDRVFLPYVNNKTITVATDRIPAPGDCFTINEFRARLKPMAPKGRGQQMGYNEGFRMCTRFCNGDAAGISPVDPMLNLRIFPNPAVNGKIIITGLEGKNTVGLYTMLGQLVKSEQAETSDLFLDLNSCPKGAYILKVTNSNSSKNIKIISQD